MTTEPRAESQQNGDATMVVLQRCPTCGGFDSPVNNIAPATTLTANPCADPFHTTEADQRG